ncbi:Fanconi anaemia protein FancD2 nuclease-domain-containing protein [Piptocephalis cylindrospora]|uniref:Fanconi anaemia protein FancD2 nuclease-domain-containing protein n=1 Tax=Piptocephalis cylindrospora TaxID=1907219 RepID=A0A4P9Y8J1_9FUNG|nr:Fanconi anaemia protein FancD2 nuclease-domain-containing protein [Piptocephalis cylindrospora]|eukprot:RKP15418.1 Fanconi anaemia protein FancD2 nuclease-domain-containing protein [Piptocephalis cylindrospora]
MFQICYNHAHGDSKEKPKKRNSQANIGLRKEGEADGTEVEEWCIKALINDMASGFPAIPGGDRGEGGSGEDAGLRRLVIFLAGCKDRIKGAKESLGLLRLLQVVAQEAYDVEDMQVAVHAVAEEFLERPKDPRSALTPNELQELLLLHLRSSASTLKCLERYVNEHLKAFEDGNADALDSNPLLVRDTLPVYLKALFTVLCEEMLLSGEEEIRGGKEAEALEAMEKHVILLTSLTMSIRKVASRDLLLMAMRQGRKFLDAFVRQALPRLEMAFSSRKDKVISILKKLQGATRVLHIVCSHSKVTKDTTLAKPAPALKKSMESLLLHVKELLRRNHSGAAFWMGNLKHRDLAGREVSSQIALESSEGDDDDDDDDGDNSDDDKGHGQIEEAEGEEIGRMNEDDEDEDDEEKAEHQRKDEHRLKQEGVIPSTPLGRRRQVGRKSVGKRAWRGKDALERATGPLKRHKNTGSKYISSMAADDGEDDEEEDDEDEDEEEKRNTDPLGLFGENLSWDDEND